jgi:GNAT superfamily N-acetyltransferase
VTALRWEPTPLTLDDADVVLGLERRVYGATEVGDRAYYEWYYRANPAGEAVIWYAATRDAAAPSAGHYAVVPVRVAVRGEPVLASLSVNTVTHPGYRRQGVFTTLAEQVFAECGRRGIAFTYGFPNPSSYPGFVGTLGFTDMGRLPLLLAPLDARALVLPGRRALGQTLGRLGAGAVLVLGRLRRARLPAESPAAEVGAAWPGWDRLWQRLRGKYPVMVVRDAAYVGWRFTACPTRRYRLYVAAVDGEPAGFAATRVTELFGMRAGLVVDLLVAPGPSGRRAGSSLVSAALGEFAAEQVALAGALAPRHADEYACLRAAGLLPCPRPLEPQPFSVILRVHPGGAPVPSEIGSWLLTMGDYDAV